MLFRSFISWSSVLALASSVPLQSPIAGHNPFLLSIPKPKPSSCFPALNFTMPAAIPDSLDEWWCDMNTEYAFVGFSYEITPCQSLGQLNTEFADIRKRFRSRYIRLYGSCDIDDYYDNIVEAAWNNGLGVHALIWFGFDGDDQWKTRRTNLFNSLHSNPKAKYVTRVVQFGSEPLYDGVMSPGDLAVQVTQAKANLSALQIPVTISEMAYGYQKNDGARQVIKAIDIIDAHILPFFSQKASTADMSWPIVLTDLKWFVGNGLGKKIWLSQNGWPSVTSPGVQPNSPNAISDVLNQEEYYKVLDSHCSDFKAVPGGGVGWFAHIYSDDQEPGYGIYRSDGQLKFPFAPRTSC